MSSITIDNRNWKAVRKVDQNDAKRRRNIKKTKSLSLDWINFTMETGQNVVRDAILECLTATLSPDHATRTNAESKLKALEVWLIELKIGFWCWNLKLAK